jgi:hypothetical protein
MKNAEKAARSMPDVVATASMAQLQSSEEYIVFVCAVLGEIDFKNSENYFKLNEETDPTTNVDLQVIASKTDLQTWDTMDEGTFQMLEGALSPKGSQNVEYWHGEPDKGTWEKEHPPIAQRRVGGLVHEGSTLWIGKDDEGVVGLDYRPNGVENVYVTGGALWPASGSWNPTMTMVALTQDLADNFENECKSFKLDESVIEKIDNTEAVEHNDVLNKLCDKNLEKFKSEQEFPKAILIGIIVGIIGALLWGTITVATGFQIGYMAIAIGAGVGISMRFMGKTKREN